MGLNPKQQQAVNRILSWLKTKENYFILTGSAGTGKTYTLTALARLLKGRVVFTAPTNKAVKVLRTALTTDNYIPECSTICSLLGLKMVGDGEVKKLTASGEGRKLNDIQLLVIDEASMLTKKLLTEIAEAVLLNNLKVVFTGDKMQLPPVNEAVSGVWGLTDLALNLTTVVRFKDDILDLVHTIRSKISHPAPTIKFKTSNDGKTGVWNLPTTRFRTSIIKAAQEQKFSQPKALVKVVAWRNVTVAKYNSLIRRNIFENAGEEFWLPGDRIILTGPAIEKGKMVAYTDEEGTIEQVTVIEHPEYPDIMCYNLSMISDENKRIAIYTLHPQGVAAYKKEKNILSRLAKETPYKWKDFWKFIEAFAPVQHGYAITAHRAQGSTYHTCYVVYNDILANHNRQEAFKCLYVACTRPKEKLILGNI